MTYCATYNEYLYRRSSNGVSRLLSLSYQLIINTSLHILTYAVTALKFLQPATYYCFEICAYLHEKSIMVRHDWYVQVPEDLPSTSLSVPVGVRDHANLRNVSEDRKLRGTFNQLSGRDHPQERPYITQPIAQLNT